MATINTLMRAAQEATTGLNDFFYNDPYNVTANGKAQTTPPCSDYFEPMTIS